MKEELVPKSGRCGLCGKPTKTHRKANFSKSKSGKSGLKVLLVRKQGWKSDGLMP